MEHVALVVGIFGITSFSFMGLFGLYTMWNNRGYSERTISLEEMNKMFKNA